MSAGLVEHVTVRVDASLAEELDREVRFRELETGIEIRRSDVVRALIRVGLATVKRSRGQT